MECGPRSVTPYMIEMTDSRVQPLPIIEINKIHDSGNCLNVILKPVLVDQFLFQCTLGRLTISISCLSHTESSCE